ncbi:DUF6226 family protein [Luteipulveratus flavus]|uniref:DUF6226 family protein n=1 Tax=Luteipulveratus flavus TaxID=3031728 RepID=A0ABT6C4P7_9MICO|nr:DUF6226 family protein [Luteipulveratus sp. YIM 133296]MDF8263929.1 DUF6226 family protein [Luteipulveratus sp. YIM 133296]
MTTYTRPDVGAQVYRDADGSVIPYGSRWDTEPPVDAYSVIEHEERFEPIGMVARALVDHLAATDDVPVVREPVEPAGHGFQHDEVVRFTPAPESAPLTVSFGRLSAEVRAGAFYENRYPVCGCDACDDDVDYLISELEAVALAVASGTFGEWVSEQDGLWAMHRFALLEGEAVEGGVGKVNPFERADLRARAATKPDTWLPWSLREDRPGAITRD